MNRCRVRDDRFYITQIRTNRGGTRTITRAISAEGNKPLPVKVGNANLAELLVQSIQDECFGPAGTLANLFHIGEMKIDEMPEGRRIDVVTCARLFAAVD